MQPGARVSAAIELLQGLHASWEEGKRLPADAALSDYYKQRRYMGSKDRAFVSEIVYFALRHGGALQWWAEQSALRQIGPRQIVLLTLVMGLDYDPALVADWCDGRQYAPKPLITEERDMLNQCADEPLEHEAMPGWARHNLQDWLIPLLLKEFGDDFASEISALNEEAPVDLRVNTLKCPDRSDLIMELDRAGYYGTPTPHSALGIRLQKRLPIFTLDAFKDGWFEMQDEGSQLVCTLVQAEAGQKVIDFCAGAGGKTLALAAKMENKGRLLAWDVNEKRLSQIRKRLARAGVDNVITHVLTSETDSFIKRHHDTADWVLVDAPCSGSGTWRRNPDLKWRFTQQDLKEIIQLQAAILASAARCVKSGGSLVYATCSLLSIENEDQIKRFLADNPDFSVEKLPQIWNKHRLWHDGEGTIIRLTPYRDQTDGFFAIRLKRS